MASTLDRQLLSVFCSPDGFNVSIRNQPAVPTHASGSVIDLVAAEEVLALDLKVSWLQEEALRSDHAFLVSTCHMATIPILKQQQVGVARWGLGSTWDDALDEVKFSLTFASCWAACALNNGTLRA